MVLNHLAAIVFFSGPVFYLGLWMVLDPAPIARLLRNRVPRATRALRVAGLVLLLLALAI